MAWTGRRRFLVLTVGVEVKAHRGSNFQQFERARHLPGLDLVFDHAYSFQGRDAVRSSIGRKHKAEQGLLKGRFETH